MRPGGRKQPFGAIGVGPPPLKEMSDATFAGRILDKTDAKHDLLINK